jgi:hypothetical protein
MIFRTLLTFLKIALLLFVAFMAWMQVPELSYDFGPKTPVEIDDPSRLTPSLISKPAFASVKGTPDFTNAFIYRRYGLDHHYFTVEPYGMKLVVRTYDKITDDWKQINRFIGRLRPFDQQPFSHYVAAIYQERFGVSVPDDAFFLALDDVPKPSGWQIGGLVLASLSWLFMFWLFFLGGIRKLSPWRSSPP